MTVNKVPESDSGASASSGGAQVVGDILRKAVLAGASAIFLTEEGVRSALSDLRLPKELGRELSEQAGKLRTEVLKGVRREFRFFLARMDWKRELTDLLTGMSLEVETRIRFVPTKDGVGVVPKVEKVRITRTDEHGAEEEAALK